VCGLVSPSSNSSWCGSPPRWVVVLVIHVAWSGCECGVGFLYGGGSASGAFDFGVAPYSG